MAFGFPPKHSFKYELNNLNKDYFLYYAIEAAKKLKWDVISIYENGFTALTPFSMVSWKEEVTVHIENNVVQTKSRCTSIQMIDYGKNRKNVENLFSTIEELKANMPFLETEEKALELRNEVLNSAPKSTNSSVTSDDKITSFFSIFIPTKDFYITPILLIVNVAIFIAMLLSGVHVLTPEIQHLLNWGANFRPYTLDGEWWRVITACFIHIGFLHLLLNMYALLYIGLILEPYLGKTRFLAAYLLTGVVASLTSLWWHDYTVSAGASGAIFGIYGVFLALMTTNVMDKTIKKSLFTSIGVFVAYNILNGFAKDSGIDNAAHIGGLISGILIGYVFLPSIQKFNDVKIKFATITGTTLLVLLSSFFVFKNLNNDIGKYEQAMERFGELEDKALMLYKLPNSSTDEDYLYEINTNGIKFWNESIVLLDSLSELSLPDHLQLKNKKLIEYCETRLKTYQLIYNAIKEETEIYNEEIDNLNSKIEAIIEELSYSS